MKVHLENFSAISDLSSGDDVGYHTEVSDITASLSSLSRLVGDVSHSFVGMKRSYVWKVENDNNHIIWLIIVRFYFHHRWKTTLSRCS